MSIKRVDINELLGADQLEVTIGERVFTVKDVPLNVFLEASQLAEGAEEAQDVRILHKQLAQLFKVDIEELTDIGFRAAALCIREITQWVYGQTESIGGGGPDGSDP
jgi:hypothetical protein